MEKKYIVTIVISVILVLIVMIILIVLLKPDKSENGTGAVDDNGTVPTTPIDTTNTETEPVHDAEETTDQGVPAETISDYQEGPEDDGSSSEQTTETGGTANTGNRKRCNDAALNNKVSSIMTILKI
jgi:hypothetical protein